MKPNLLNLLKDTNIPEAIRAEIAKQSFITENAKLSQALEIEKLEAEKRKSFLNAPFIAALAGLLTLSATFIFDTLTGQNDTSNTITLEQHRQELKDAESRTVANLEAQAKEREFQYEIVKSELADASKTNAQRADVLLFLAKAGILNSLNTDELIQMAEKQRDNPNENIIPSFGGNNDARSAGILADRVSVEDPVFSSLSAVGKVENTFGSCTAFLTSKNTLVVPNFCLEENSPTNFFILNDRKIEIKTWSLPKGSPPYGISKVQLMQDINNVVPLETSTTAPVIGNTVGIVFFGTDKKRVIWDKQKCFITEVGKIDFDYNCNLPKGSSGSPIIDKISSKVIGVHIAELELPDGRRTSNASRIAFE